MTWPLKRQQPLIDNIRQMLPAFGMHMLRISVPVPGHVRTPVTRDERYCRWETKALAIPNIYKRFGTAVSRRLFRPRDAQSVAMSAASLHTMARASSQDQLLSARRRACLFCDHLAASTCRNMIRTSAATIAGAGKGTGLAYNWVLGRLSGHHDFAPPFSLCSSLGPRVGVFLGGHTAGPRKASYATWPRREQLYSSQRRAVQLTSCRRFFRASADLAW